MTARPTVTSQLLCQDESSCSGKDTPRTFCDKPLPSVDSRCGGLGTESSVCALTDRRVMNLSSPGQDHAGPKLKDGTLDLLFLHPGCVRVVYSGVHSRTINRFGIYCEGHDWNHVSKDAICDVTPCLWMTITQDWEAQVSDRGCIASVESRSVLFSLRH